MPSPAKHPVLVGSTLEPHTSRGAAKMYPLSSWRSRGGYRASPRMPEPRSRWSPRSRVLTRQPHGACSACSASPWVREDATRPSARSPSVPVRLSGWASRHGTVKGSPVSLPEAATAVHKKANPQVRRAKKARFWYQTPRSAFGRRSQRSVHCLLSTRRVSTSPPAS
jgi:hypothetical protein